MSNSLGQTMLAWQDVAATLQRKSVSWRGNPLSERDQRTFTEAVVMCALHLADMSSRYEGIGSHRELVAWVHLVHTLDVSDLGSFLSDAITALRHVSEPIAYGGFKRPLQSKYPFAGAFLAPMRQALESFLQCPSPTGFYPCYQFLNFLTHLSLQDLNIDLEGEYEDMEAYLRALSYPPAYITEMNAIMREWMSGFAISEDNFFPKHGPGATAEAPRASLNLEKYQFLGTDPMIDYVFRKHAGLDVRTYFPLAPTKGICRESRLVFVPKSMKTRRSISAEPTTLQYLQQGVSKAIDRYIQSHSFLRRHIDLHKQQINGLLAVESSRTQKLATIDLSSASDTVTLSLVKAVFRGTPLYPFLVALRSKTVKLPSGKVIEVEKYAPMGSALCFPVETLIFSCAIELAVRRAFREGLGSHPTWRAYGDDIIVEAAIYEDVLRILGSLGFIANESKSFGPGERFRESCGHEGYDGVDVTPMRISRKFHHSPERWTSSHAACFTGLVDMANYCHVYDFRLLRAWIVRVLLSDTTCPPLFSEDGHGSVYSPVPDNYRAQWRLNLKLQREEVLIRRSSAKPRKGSKEFDDDRVRLFEWLRLASQRQGDVIDPEDAIVVPRRPSVDLLSCVWVNNPAPRLAVAELKSALSDNNGGEVEQAQ